MSSAARLAELVAPLELAAFFDDYVGRQPTVLRGGPERVQGLISLPRVVEALAGPADPAGQFLLRDEQLAPDAVPSPAFVARLGSPPAAGTDAVWAYLEQGH